MEAIIDREVVAEITSHYHALRRWCPYTLSKTRRNMSML
jgi:hypothetical protein